MIKKVILRDAIPWLVWMILFLALSVIGMRNGQTGPVSNPRSLETVTAHTNEKHRKTATGDCGGNTLLDKGELRDTK